MSNPTEDLAENLYEWCLEQGMTEEEAEAYTYLALEEYE